MKYINVITEESKNGIISPSLEFVEIFNGVFKYLPIFINDTKKMRGIVIEKARWDYIDTFLNENHETKSFIEKVTMYKNLKNGL